VTGPVSTWNEWDPLEEIIVGIVDDALVPPWETITPAVVHDRTQWPFVNAPR
jgi:glycine amidinotransferase